MAGYVVLEAANLDEALSKLERQPVSVVLAALDHNQVVIGISIRSVSRKTKPAVVSPTGCSEQQAAGASDRGAPAPPPPLAGEDKQAAS